MWQLNLIFFFTLNLIGACFQVDYQAFFPTKLITQNKSNYLLSVNLDDYLQQAKKNFALKQNFVNLNKFLELDVSQIFVNYSSFDLLLQNEYQDTINYKNFEFIYGLNPWCKKFFQRIKTNFDFVIAEVEFLVGVEENYSLLNYLAGLNFIIDLQMFF
jgi:hypothetical protein